jgi:hypothetical protein
VRCLAPQFARQSLPSVHSCHLPWRVLATLCAGLSTLERGEGPSHRSDAHASPLRDLAPGKAFCSQLGDLVASENDSRTPNRPAASCSARHRPKQPRANSLTDTNTLLFRDHREDRNHGISKHSARIEIRFGERSEPDSGIVEPLQVHVRLSDAFAAESIQRPKHNYIESAPRRIRHHGPELSAIGLAAGLVILILDHNRSLLRCAEFSELFKLVRCVLAFIAR